MEIFGRYSLDDNINRLSTEICFEEDGQKMVNVINYVRSSPQMSSQRRTLWVHCQTWSWLVAVYNYILINQKIK